MLHNTEHPVCLALFNNKSLFGYETQDFIYRKIKHNLRK